MLLRADIDVNDASVCPITAVLEPGATVRCIGVAHVEEPYGSDSSGDATTPTSTDTSARSGPRAGASGRRRHRLQCALGWVSMVSTDGKRLLVDTQDAISASLIGYV